MEIPPDRHAHQCCAMDESSSRDQSLIRWWRCRMEIPQKDTPTSVAQCMTHHHVINPPGRWRRCSTEIPQKDTPTSVAQCMSHHHVINPPGRWRRCGMENPPDRHAHQCCAMHDSSSRDQASRPLAAPWHGKSPERHAYRCCAMHESSSIFRTTGWRHSDGYFAMGNPLLGTFFPPYANESSSIFRRGGLSYDVMQSGYVD